MSLFSHPTYTPAYRNSPLYDRAYSLISDMPGRRTIFGVHSKTVDDANTVCNMVYTWIQGNPEQQNPDPQQLRLLMNGPTLLALGGSFMEVWWGRVYVGRFATQA